MISSIEMIGNTISSAEDRGENDLTSKEIDEKENEVGTSRKISLPEKGKTENSRKDYQDVFALSLNNTNKNEFGPLSPVTLNVGSNHVTKERILSRHSRASFQEAQIPKLVDRSSKKKEDFVDESFVFEEGNSLIGEVAMYAEAEEKKLLLRMIDHQNRNKIQASNESFMLKDGDSSLIDDVANLAVEEEEKQLEKMTVNDRNKITRNNSILDQSKKLVGFLGGSIKTALQHHHSVDDHSTSALERKIVREEEATIDEKLVPVVETPVPGVESVEEPSGNPNNQRSRGLNNFVGDLMDKLGSNKSSSESNNNNDQSTYGRVDPNIQSKSEGFQAGLDDAYEETTDLEQQKDESTEESSLDDSQDTDNQPIPDTGESPTLQPKSKYWESLILRSEETKNMKYGYGDAAFSLPENTENETVQPAPGKEMKQAENEFEDRIQEEHTSTNIETPYVDKSALGGRGEKNGSPLDKSFQEPSPQSMISIPDDYSPGDGAPESKVSPKNKGIKSREENSPGSLMYNMISAATNIETPLVCKGRPSVSFKNNMVDSSPAVSDFGNMLSSATAAQTPQQTFRIVNDSPKISEFANLLTKISSEHPPREDLEENKTTHDSANPLVSKKRTPSLTTENSSSRKVASKMMDSTPVKSNKTAVFRDVLSDTSLQSNCDESEDGSIYTSLSIHSSIQSNTPRSRRVMEWIDPTAPDIVSWPTPSMTSNLRSSETPERQLPATKQCLKSTAMGTGQYLQLQKKIKAKPKSSNKFDNLIPRTTQVGSSASPSSLPSMLGSASCYEVSDLESPNIVMLPLGFKFSDEESTIQSQSIHEGSETLSLPTMENLQTIVSPKSLMTVATPTEGYPTDEEYSLNQNSPTTNLNTLKGDAGIESIVHQSASSRLSLFTNSKKENSLHSMDAIESVKGNAAVKNTSKLSASSRVTFSTSDSKGNCSPHSTVTNESFKRDADDKKCFKSSTCLKRCITFGMVVAIMGAISTLAIIIMNLTQKDGPKTNDGEWRNESWRQSPSQTSKINISVETVSPTFGSTYIDTSTTKSPTYYPTFFPTLGPEPLSTNGPSLPIQPTSKPSEVTPIPSFKPTYAPTIVVEVPRTGSPTIQSVLIPSSIEKTSAPSSESTPGPTMESTKVGELNVDPSFKPTFAPMSIPTFTDEQIEQLTWNRIVNGENIWRKSKSEVDRTPLWYFAADSAPGIQLRVINAAKGENFSKQLRTAIDDYGRSKAINSMEFSEIPYEILCAPPKRGEIKICSGDFGDTDWIGSTILFMREEYIVSALIRINESLSSSASDARLQYTLCHQLGHSLGVVHNDNDFGFSSCMKDFGENVIVDDNIIQTNTKLQHPNSDDLDYLVTLYGLGTTSRMLRGRS